MTKKPRKIPQKSRRRRSSKSPLARVGITLPPSLARRVRAYCEASETSFSEFVERAARRYLKRVETLENKAFAPPVEANETPTFVGLSVDDERGVITVY